MELRGRADLSDSATGTHVALPTRKVPIDVMRTMSMLYIIGFWHLLDYTNIVRWHHNPVTYRLTVAALSLFVFISGFLTGRNDGVLAHGEIWRFYRTRFWRILRIVSGSRDERYPYFSQGRHTCRNATSPATIHAVVPKHARTLLFDCPAAHSLAWERSGLHRLMRRDRRSHGSVSSRNWKDRYAPDPLFPLLRCRHISGCSLSSLVVTKPHRPPTSRRSVSRAYACTSVLEVGGRSMGGALGAFRLDRSFCFRHARCSEFKIACHSDAAQRSELFHVPSASSALSLDADRLVSECREGAGFLSAVRMSPGHRDRGMALSEGLHKIFARGVRFESPNSR